MSAALEGLVQGVDTDEALARARATGQSKQMGKCDALELGGTEWASVFQKWCLMRAGDRLKVAFFSAENCSQLIHFDNGYFLV